MRYRKPRGWIPPSVSLLFAIGLLAESIPRAAASGGVQHRLAAGLKGGYLLGKGHGPAVHHGGGGPFFEVVVVPRWLEAELGFKVLGSSHGTLMPIDLLAKIPIPLSHTVHGYFGVGPTVVVSFAEPEASAHIGLASLVGATFMLSPRWGILVEAGYNMIVEQGNTVHELAASTGLALRF